MNGFADAERCSCCSFYICLKEAVACCCLCFSCVWAMLGSSCAIARYSCVFGHECVCERAFIWAVSNVTQFWLGKFGDHIVRWLRLPPTTFRASCVCTAIEKAVEMGVVLQWKAHTRILPLSLPISLALICGLY